jgi:hypothetical protein
MFRSLEKFDEDRAHVVKNEATQAVERVAKVFRARIQELVSLEDPIEGGIFPAGTGDRQRDLTDQVRAQLRSVGYQLSEDLTSVILHKSTSTTRQDVPLPPSSRAKQDSKMFAWGWVAEQLHTRKDKTLLALDQFVIDFPTISERSKCEPFDSVYTLLHRLKRLEPVARWITQTSALDIAFTAEGLHVKRKDDPVKLEAALLRRNMLLFSAVVLLSRGSLPAVKGPDWSGLPRPVLCIIQRFLVGVYQKIQAIQVC